MFIHDHSILSILASITCSSVCIAWLCVVGLAYVAVICVNCTVITDPDETLAVNHTLEPDMYSGIYNFTAYISLLKHDPLLLASILHFKTNQRGLPTDLTRAEVNPAENVVKAKFMLE